MPFSEIIVLAGIICAFAIFGVVLAWGDYQTRGLRRERSEPAAPEQRRLKDAA